ncbi:hypothetical protein, partial [Enterobacter intestinihominis]
FAYCKGVFPCSPAPPPHRSKKPPKNFVKKTTTKKKKNNSHIKKIKKKKYKTQRVGELSVLKKRRSRPLHPGVFIGGGGLI